MVHRVYNPKDEVAHRHRRQVRRIRRLLQDPQGSAGPRRARAQPEAAHHLDRSRGRWKRRTDCERAARRLRRHPGSRRLRQARHRRHAQRHPLRPRAARSRTSASASACRRACIEYARNVCGLNGANSSEFDPATPHRVIYKLRELTGVDELGGTMRLGAWPCVLRAGSFAREGLRRDRDHRTPPPPLRVQPRVRSASDRRRPAHHRRHARRDLRRDRRDPRPSLVPRLPVPSRIQIQAAGAASAVQQLRQSQL